MPSVIRGGDGFDSDIHQGIGVNQTWQDVTASRTGGVTYTNTTGKPIYISVSAYNTATTSYMQFSIDSVDNIVDGDSDAGLNVGGCKMAGQFIIPDGSAYQVNIHNGAFEKWNELR